MTHTRQFLPPEILFQLNDGEEEASEHSIQSEEMAFENGENARHHTGSRISFGDFIQFQTTMFAGARFEALIFGNADDDSAAPLFAALKNSIPSMDGISCDWDRIETREIKIPLASSITNSATYTSTNTAQLRGSFPSITSDFDESPSVTVSMSTFNTRQLNTGVVVMFQLGERSVENDVIADILLDHIFKEEFFHQLRTQEMLGYIVDCSLRRNSGYSSLVCIVETPSASADKVSSRINQFAHQFLLQKLMDLDEMDLQRIIGSLVQIRKIAPTSSIAAVNQLWEEIVTHRYLFNRPTLEIAALLRVSKEQLLSFYKTKVLGFESDSQKQPQRRWISVQLYKNGSTKVTKQKLDGAEDELNNHISQYTVDVQRIKGNKPPIILKSMNEVEVFVQDMIYKGEDGLYPSKLPLDPTTLVHSKFEV